MSGTLPRPLTQTHSVQHKNWNISKIILNFSWNCDMLQLFLCYLICFIKIWVTALIFTLLLLIARLPLSQAGQHKKNPRHFACVRALITRCVRLSRVKFCTVRVRNAILWNPFSSPEATILLDSTKNRYLSPVPVFEHAQKVLSSIFSHSVLSDLTSPWIEDLRCWEGPEVSILGADQKDRGLWGRECVESPF